MPLACLPWYDFAEIQPLNDRLWTLIAASLRERGLPSVPASLDRRTDYRAQWREPGLLLGQACGYDVLIANEHSLQIVGVPHYAMKGCEAGKYRSFIIVRDDSNHGSLEDLEGARCVINSPRSHSGMNVLQALIAPLAKSGRFFGSVAVSGAHEYSLAMIEDGRADVASIDCITYGLLEKHRPSSLRRIRVIQKTALHAAPPFVTGHDTPAQVVDILREAIRRAISQLSSSDRMAIGLNDISSADSSDYHTMYEYLELAQRVGYRELSELNMPSA